MSTEKTLPRATEEAMGNLHEQLANTLKDALNQRDPDTGLPNAALLSVARQFLKDNRIEVGPGVKTGPLHGLAGLPIFGDEDGNVTPIRKAS